MNKTMNTWYPVTEEPQRHFVSAIEAYAKKDCKAAANMRKATVYLHLEAGRVTDDAKHALDSSVAEPDKLAASVEKDAAKDEKLMDKDFARANHALALAHRTRAAESWARKEYDKAGYELKAVAHGLESPQVGPRCLLSGGRYPGMGDKLASGATWTRDEVAKGFESLGNALNELGHKIGAKQQAAPVKSGS